MADLSELLGVGVGGSEIAALTAGILILVIIVMIWKLIWYGIALYKTIQRKQLRWFVVLFVAAFLLGDVGILAIIYLLIYREPKGTPAGKSAVKPMKSVEKKAGKKK